MKALKVENRRGAAGLGASVRIPMVTGFAAIGEDLARALLNWFGKK